MSECVKPHSRVPQVLKILYEFGPLSTTAMSNILKPTMQIRRVQDCLLRLRKRGLVVKRKKTNSFFSENFYQLSTSSIAKAELSKYLDIDAKSLNIPTFRVHDVEHSIVCACWSDYFRNAFPNASVVRDFHISSRPDILQRLMIGTDLEMYPDVVVFLDSDELDDNVTLAIEIEKTPKTRKRIFHKLNKFSTRSHIDGIIYICPNHSIIDLVGGVYAQRIKATARRVRQYGDHFLMFSNSFSPLNQSELKLYSSSGSTINLKSWTNTLLTEKWQKRRDEMFLLQRTDADV